MNSNQLDQIVKVEEKLRKDIEYISDFIFKNPELSDEEYLASKFLSDTLKKYGFEVKYPYCNIETAFRAELKNGKGPKVAFLAEYDALPGYGEKPAHACGHNWIAAASSGSAMVLSKLLDKFQGTIVVIGTPSEESYGAKVNMVEAGAFDDIDIVLQAHLESATNVNYKSMAMRAIQFEFQGKAAHAATYPHEGINALDAVRLTFNGLDAMRQQLLPEARIHGIIDNGGEVANVIPQYASCKFYTRASSRDYCMVITEKLINCAKGAALMTGCEMKHSYYENVLDDLINVPKLQEITKEAMEDVGINDFINSDNAPAGSTDIGNVSYVCPTMYVEVALDNINDFFVHDEKALEYVNSQYAYKKLHQMVQAFAQIALKLFNDEETLTEIKKWHENFQINSQII